MKVVIIFIENLCKDSRAKEQCFFFHLFHFHFDLLLRITLMCFYRVRTQRLVVGEHTR